MGSARISSITQRRVPLAINALYLIFSHSHHNPHPLLTFNSDLESGQMDPIINVITSKVHVTQLMTSFSFSPFTPLVIAVSSISLLVLLVLLFEWGRKPLPVTLNSPEKPALVACGLTCRDLVEQYCSSLKEGFRPSWWLPNGHAQTIYSAMADFSAEDQITYERVLLRVPDGGTIGVDIYPARLVALPLISPIVILNHGLTGGSHESYVRNTAVNIAKPVVEGGLGGRVAVVNFRGCAGTPVTSPHLYSSGATLDVHTAVMYLSTLYPQSPMLGIGFSLGAAVMTRYLGEQGDRCRIKAATVLCAPLELRSMSAKLDARRIFPKLYSYSMARKMLSSFSAHLSPDRPLCDPSSPLHQHLSTLRKMSNRYQWTLRASHVTELVVAKIGGSSDHFPFEGLEQFLEWACPGAWVKGIRRPTLAISALDDPIVSGDCLPYQSVRESSHMVLATLSRGGHLAWFDGPLYGPERHRRWHVKPVVEFLRAALELPSHEFGLVKVVRKDGWTYAGDARWMVVK